uniref:Uncharacterized protein n=1 Tax=Sphaerodactylus townsendi TaxID=933632 RepID=A0ACB8GEE9_9SAUR
MTSIMRILRINKTHLDSSSYQPRAPVHKVMNFRNVSFNISGISWGSNGVDRIFFAIPEQTIRCAVEWRTELIAAVVLQPSTERNLTLAEIAISDDIPDLHYALNSKGYRWSKKFSDRLTGYDVRGNASLRFRKRKRIRFNSQHLTEDKAGPRQTGQRPIERNRTNGTRNGSSPAFSTGEIAQK